MNITTITKDLRIAFWNIDSAGKKLEDLTVIQKLRNFDIVCLAETHCKPGDILTLEGFVVIPKLRLDTLHAHRFFGGLAICVRESMLKGTEILESESSELMWMKLSKKFFNLEDNIFICNSYVTPVTSKVGARLEPVFEVLESEALSFSRLGNILVCGDTNARTAMEPDFIEPVTFALNNDSPLDITSAPCPIRHNLDTRPPGSDSHGHELLDFCKVTDTRILNGRVLGDSLGRFTCYTDHGKPSVIDYMLYSAKAFNDVAYFKVHEPLLHFSPHCIISTIIKTKQFNTFPKSEPELGTQDFCNFYWDKTSHNAYQTALNLPINSTKLNSLLNDEIASVENLTNSLTDIMIQSAITAGIKRRKPRNKNKRKKKKQHKKWYDQDCTLLHNKLRRLARRLHENPQCNIILNEFRQTRKSYKKLLKHKKLIFKANMFDQLDELRKTDSPAYWDLFEKLRELDKPKTTNPISSIEWVRYFEQHVNSSQRLTQTEKENKREQYVEDHIDIINNELNYNITNDEIKLCIKKLKNKKSSGADYILNEMIKAGKEQILPILLKLFNKIFSSRTFPTVWQNNTLTPIFKKGDPSNPSNYRGIAVSSALCKLYCSVLKNRLQNFSDKNQLIPDCQIGYRKDCRTSDHILTLKSVIDKYLQKSIKHRLHCCFVDFKAAFDSISRKELFYKLLKLEIGGTFLASLRAMYGNVNFAVKTDGKVSEYFKSNLGVKQGCTLSPLLFNLFIADLPLIFDHNCDPAILNDSKLSCLMFADDLIIMSQSASGLQNSLNNLEKYCTEWGLEVNLSKTKILIFTPSSRILKSVDFHYRGQIIEIAREYCYLGINITLNGSFNPATTRLATQAKRALFKLSQIDIRRNVEIAIHLYKSLVLPIAFYCSEIWAPLYMKKLSKTEDNLYTVCDKFPLEKLNLKFCKYILGVKRNSKNGAVRGELGMRPLLVELLGRACNYWMRICNRDPSSLVYKAYTENKSIDDSWAAMMKKICIFGNSETLWDSQGSQTIAAETRKLKDAFIQKYDACWHEELNKIEHNKLRTYAKFKSKHELEPYLTWSHKPQQRINITKLRISDHKLQIELGRHHKPSIDANLRYCSKCTNSVDDERHAILKCTKYESVRAKVFRELEGYTIFKDLSDDEQFLFIMRLGDDVEIFKTVAPLFTDIIQYDEIEK